MELTCTFQLSYYEREQLDLKWYYSSHQEPFLQWLPSSGREPQIRGQRFSSSITVRHLVKNTTTDQRVEQVLRLEQPTTLLSGEYHCRVATFTHEERRSHRMTVFGRNMVKVISDCRGYSRPRCWSSATVSRG